MPNLTWNPDLVARSYDVKKNGIIDSLKIDAAALAALDTSKDGKVSVDELSAGIAKDTIVISQGAVTLAKGKLQASTAGKLNESIDASNKVIYAASRDLDDLDVSAKKSKQPDINWAIEQYNRGVAIINQFNAVVSRSFSGPSRHETEVMNDLRAKMGRYDGLAERIKGINPDAQRDQLALQARSVYEAAVDHLQGGEEPAGPEIGRVSVDMDRIAKNAAGIGQQAQRDKALLDSPSID